MGRMTSCAAIGAAALGLAVLCATTVQAQAAKSALCADPQGFCGLQLSASCLQRLGAGALAADDPECGDRLALYRDCLSLVAGQCGGEQAAAAGAQSGAAASDTASMMAVWAEIKDADSAPALEAFAAAYPGTPLAALALERAERLKAAAAAPASKPEKRSDPPVQPTPARSVQEGVARLQEIAAESDRCFEGVRGAPSGKRTESLIPSGLDDPEIARKTADPAMVDDDLARDIIDRRNRAAACNAGFVEQASGLALALTAASLLYVQAEDSAAAEFLSGRISLGAANTRTVAAAKTLQQQLAVYMLAVSASGVWSPGGATEKDATANALEGWTRAQERLKAAAPGATLYRCVWRGARLDCDG